MSSPARPRRAARVRRSPRPARAGFTLIELLMVVVIIGILAALAIPRLSATKGRANAAKVKSDLHNLTVAQEGYFYEKSTYAPSLSLLNVSASEGVNMTIVEATSSGWSATAVHPASVPVTCAIFYGSAAPVAPATTEGIVACR